MISDLKIERVPGKTIWNVLCDGEMIGQVSRHRRRRNKAGHTLWRNSSASTYYGSRDEAVAKLCELSKGTA